MTTKTCFFNLSKKRGGSDWDSHILQIQFGFTFMENATTR